MKRLRSFGEDMGDVGGKDWERREVDSERPLSRRGFYMKSESLRRSASSVYDRSVEDDREFMRHPRKRFDHEVDGSDRRKNFDRYRDGGGGSGSGGCGVDRPMHVSSSRSSYGSERMHRLESFSAIRRDFPKGFRSERDRSRREGCGGSSWRRLSYGKEAAEEEKTPPRDSEDRTKTRSRDSSSGEQSKDLEPIKAEMEKFQGESCSSSEMEEGELEPDPQPEPSIDTAGQAEMDSQNCKTKVDEAKSVSELSSENKDALLSSRKSCSLDGTSGEERSMQMEVDQATGNGTIQDGKNEHSELVKELDKEISGVGEGFVESKEQRESLGERREEEDDLVEGICKEEKLEVTYHGEKDESVGVENSYLHSQDSNLEMKHHLTTRAVSDDELAIVYSSLERNLEEKVSEVHVREVDTEQKEEASTSIGVVRWKDKEVEQVGFRKEQSHGKDTDFQTIDGGETVCFSSFKEITSEDNLAMRPVACKLKESPKDKGKSIAHSLSNVADSMEDGIAVEGPSRRGFELVFQDHVSQQDKASISGFLTGNIMNKKLKLEPLDLSLGLPGILPDLSSKPSNSQPYSPGHTRSIQSFPSSFRTASDGFTNSISFSSSQPFVHNPSYSLTQNSMDTYEQSVVSRPIFQGVDQASSGSIWPSPTISEPKRKGGAGALFHRVLLNGNHYQKSVKGTNGHHHLNSCAVLRQTSFPKQLSPPQSVGSHDMLPDHSQDKRAITRERSFNSVPRSEQREGQEIIVNTLNVVERIISRIVSEPLQVMERMLQDMTEHSIEYLKDSICKMLLNADKRGQIYTLQVALRRRSDLTSETMTRCSRTLLEILVALKTELPDFLQKPNNASSSDLVEIYHNLKCRNVACRSLLPVDDCDCKICSQKNGFCSACMCLICSKFDMASNTCSWVGCDVCLHWCHTDCGLHGSHIRNGRSSSVAPGAMEMQFHCVACGHPSEMFGFVKEVFKMCSKDWKAENIAKELHYVRRIFSGSNDVRGKTLYQVAGQMLVKLEEKMKHSEVIKYIMALLSESDSGISNPPLYSSREISGNNKQRSNDVTFPREQNALFSSISSSKVSRLQHKAAPPITENDHMNERKPIVDELESVVGFKQAEARMYQERADNARREAEGLKRIAAAKSGKIDEDYSSRVSKLQVQEAEERRRQKLEELQAVERAHHDFTTLKTRMEVEIKDLLLKMEATKRNINA